MVIVVGATGFIGMYTTKGFLDEGTSVIATGRNKRIGKTLGNMGAEFIELDITNKKDYEKLPTHNIEAVIILAGLLPANSTSDLQTDDNAADYFKVNVIGTINVLEWCRKNNVKKVIGNCSYGDVSGAWGNVSSITEDEPRNFAFTGDHAAYVISRNASNDIMEYYNQQYDMQCSWFRFPPVYGVGPHGTIYVDGKPYKSAVATWIDNAKQGKDIEIWGDKNISRDIVYVKDVANAYVQASKSDNTRGLYNMTSGKAVTLWDQANIIADVFCEGTHSKVINRPELTNNTPSFLFDISKARRDFGYNPQYTDFRKMMQDYKKEQNNPMLMALQERQNKN